MSRMYTAVKKPSEGLLRYLDQSKLEELEEQIEITMSRLYDLFNSISGIEGIRPYYDNDMIIVEYTVENHHPLYCSLLYETVYLDAINQDGRNDRIDTFFNTFPAIIKARVEQIRNANP